MITLLGVLLLLLAATIYFWNKRVTAAEAFNADLTKRKENSSSNFWREDLKSVPMKFPVNIKPFILVILGVLTICLNGMFFYADAGTAYAVQYPWGGDKLIKTQGLKLKWWGRTIPLSYELSIKDVIAGTDAEGNMHDLEDNERGVYNRYAQYWEFSDAIKAKIAVAVVISMNTDDEIGFLEMADKNRSEGKLLNGRVLPNIDAALKNTAKLMDAQEYISGKASEFDRMFRDQLNNGVYIEV